MLYSYTHENGNSMKQYEGLVSPAHLINYPWNSWHSYNRRGFASADIQ